MHVFLCDKWSQCVTFPVKIRIENWPGRLKANTTLYYASYSSCRTEGMHVLWFLQASCSESDSLAYFMNVGKDPGKKDQLGAGEMAHWEERLLSCLHSISSAHIRLLRAAQSFSSSSRGIQHLVWEHPCFCAHVHTDRQTWFIFFTNKKVTSPRWIEVRWGDDDSDAGGHCHHVQHGRNVGKYRVTGPQPAAP